MCIYIYMGMMLLKQKSSSDTQFFDHLRLDGLLKESPLRLFRPGPA